MVGVEVGLSKEFASGSAGESIPSCNGICCGMWCTLAGECNCKEEKLRTLVERSTRGLTPK